MRKLFATLAVVALAATGCAGSESRAQGEKGVLRLGIFPNLTHAPGHIAIGSGLLNEALASTKTRVKATVFNSGSDAGTALLAGSIDATYIGPGPSVNLFLQSEGGVAVVSGVAAGGASLVVRTGAGIDEAADLAGRKIAVPSIGNTQDVALRTWLAAEGLETKDAGGDVAVVAVDNPELPQLFEAGEIDAAWEPEPWPSLLVHEGLAEELVDEADLWSGGEFVTTNLLVNTTYMEGHPKEIRALVEANLQAIEMIESDPDEARDIAQKELADAGARALPQEAVDAAWERLTFTWDPLPASLAKGADDANTLGYLDDDPVDILDIYRLDNLNSLLGERGEPAIEVSR